MWHFKYVFSKNERRILLLASILLFTSLGGLFYHFYEENGSLLITATEGQVYSEGFLDDLNILNPLFVVKDSPEEDVTSFIFSGLLRKDKDRFGLLPDLAAAYAINARGNEYTFHLRDDVYWHDGVKFTLEDVLFTFSILKNKDYFTSYGHIFDDVVLEVIGKNTLKVIIPEADHYFISNFTLPILPKHLLSNLSYEDFINSGFNLNPIGTGQFKFQSLERTDDSVYLTLIENSTYHLEKAIIKKILFQFFSEKADYDKYTNRFKGILKNAKVDQIDLNGFVKSNFEASQYQILFFNTESEFLKNRGVRQAIYLGANFPDVVEKMQYKPVFRKMLTVEETRSNEDPKELLYTNGWQIYSQEYKDNFRRNISRERMTLKMITLNDPYYLEIAEVLKKRMADLGITLIYAGFNQEELGYDFLLNKNYDILLLGVKVDNPEDLFPFLHSTESSKNSGLNFSNYSNLEVDLLLEDMRMAVDQNKRQRVLLELKKRLELDVPMIFISSGYLDYYYSKSLSGVNKPYRVYSYKDRFLTFSSWRIDNSNLQLNVSGQ